MTVTNSNTFLSLVIQMFWLDSFFFFFFLSVPTGLWDPSSLTRDWTSTLWSKKHPVLTTAAPRNYPDIACLWRIFWAENRASLVAQAVKNPPAMWETWVWSLGWEDALEEGMATHSSILAWRIPTDRSLAGTPWGYKESDTTDRLSTHQGYFKVSLPNFTHYMK